MVEILSLEIAEGCQLNNLINEIEKAFSCYLRMGNKYYRRGEKNIALKNYRKALKIDPDNKQKLILETCIYNTMTDLIYDMYDEAELLYKTNEYTLSLFYHTKLIAYCIETHQMYLPIIKESKKMINIILIKQGEDIYDISGDGNDYLNEF